MHFSRMGHHAIAPSGWEQVTFEPPFPPAAKVVVFPQLQTPAPLIVQVQIRHVTAMGFELKLSETALDQIVGWVAHASLEPLHPPRALKVFQAIAEMNANLSPQDRSLKYEKMRISAYGFYRGTNHLFWQDHVQKTAELNRFSNAHTQTWIQGDLHVLNYGVFDNAQGELVYDLNDFDEAVIADYQYDLWRLAASMVLVAQEQAKLTLTDAEDAIAATARRYVHTVQTVTPEAALRVQHDRDRTYGRLDDLIEDTADVASRAEMLDKWRSRDRGFRMDAEKLSPVTAHERAALTQALHPYQPPTHYRVLDWAVRRRAGTGSLGLPRYYALIEDANGIERILDLKQQQTPTALGFLPPIHSQAHGQRFGEAEAERHTWAYRALSAAPDPWLGHVTVFGAPYSVRERSPYKAALDLAEITSHKRFRKLAAQWGEILAIAHLRASHREPHLQIWAEHVQQVTRDREVEFTEQLIAIATDYATTVQDDWLTWTRMIAEYD